MKSNKPDYIDTTMILKTKNNQLTNIRMNMHIEYIPQSVLEYSFYLELRTVIK